MGNLCGAYCAAADIIIRGLLRDSILVPRRRIEHVNIRRAIVLRQASHDVSTPNFQVLFGYVPRRFVPARRWFRALPLWKVPCFSMWYGEAEPGLHAECIIWGVLEHRV